MMLGLSLSAFTTLHVIISLIGIVTGLAWLVGVLNSRPPGVLTAIFLASTVLTSVTGFMFPIHELLPSHITGIISLVVLAVALVALYGLKLGGPWRWIYVVTAVASLYLNAFVGVVQAFLKVSFLQPLAPTQQEPPFLVAQVAVLALFLVLGYLGVKRFHPVGRVA